MTEVTGDQGGERRRGSCCCSTLHGAVAAGA